MYEDSLAQLARLHSIDTPQDHRDPKLHVVKRTFHHRREKYEIALAMVIRCENELEIDPGQRWELDSPMCRDAFIAGTQHGYWRALDRLSQAVVQRILESHKMGLPGTCKCCNHCLQILIRLHGLGYKQRKKISEGLKKRSKAVNTLLNEYNEQAKCIGRPVLDFQQVVEYSFLSDFELLHHMCNDITQTPWANPVIRTAMISWMKTERAKEEIIRLNVEARRLKTYIRDSSLARRRAIEDLRQTDPALAAELQERHSAQSSLDTVLSRQLHKMQLLPGFLGRIIPGVRAGGDLEDPRSESDEDGGDMGELDDMEHGTVADAAVEDDIVDQLFALDNLRSDSVPTSS
jgi:hypothetical protein